MTLTEIRKGLPPRVSEWVDAVLAGEQNVNLARRTGVTADTAATYATFFAQVCGLDIPTRSVREAVLRMRISELEAANGRP